MSNYLIIISKVSRIQILSEVGGKMRSARGVDPIMRAGRLSLWKRSGQDGGDSAAPAPASACCGCGHAERGPPGPTVRVRSEIAGISETFKSDKRL